MFAFFIVFIFTLFAPVMLARIYVAARHATVRARCYRRASLDSLARAARRSAIVRHYGRA